MHGVFVMILMVIGSKSSKASVFVTGVNEVLNVLGMLAGEA